MNCQKMTSGLSVQGTLSIEAFTRRVADVLAGHGTGGEDAPLERALSLFMSRYSLYSGGYLLSHLGKAMMDWHIHSFLSERKENRGGVWFSIDVMDNDLIDMTIFLPLPEASSRSSEYFDHRLTGESRAIYLSYEAAPKAWSMTAAAQE